MSRTIVVENNLEDAIKKFRRIANETRRDVKPHQFYVKPGLRARLKSEAVRKRKKY